LDMSSGPSQRARLMGPTTTLPAWGRSLLALMGEQMLRWLDPTTPRVGFLAWPCCMCNSPCVRVPNRESTPRAFFVYFRRTHVASLPMTNSGGYSFSTPFLSFPSLLPHPANAHLIPSLAGLRHFVRTCASRLRGVLRKVIMHVCLASLRRIPR